MYFKKSWQTILNIGHVIRKYLCNYLKIKFNDNVIIDKIIHNT